MERVIDEPTIGLSNTTQMNLGWVGPSPKSERRAKDQVYARGKYVEPPATNGSEE
jgi:hypothetical protein